MSYIDERNAALRVLRDMVQTTSGKKQAALKFAVEHLDGLPEHWVADESDNRAHPGSQCGCTNCLMQFP